MIIWGFSFLATKELLPAVPVLALLFARFAIAAILLAAYAAAAGGWRKQLRVSRRDLGMLAALSCLSPVGYFLFETYGVAWTQASHVAILIATIPIGVYLIAFARKMERVTWSRSAGFLLAFEAPSCSSILRAGVARALPATSSFSAVVCAAIQTILLKNAVRRVTPLQLTFYQALLSRCPACSPRSTASRGFRNSPQGWGTFFLAVFARRGVPRDELRARYLSATSGAGQPRAGGHADRGGSAAFRPTYGLLAGTLLVLAGVRHTAGRRVVAPAGGGG
jgi:drug/metabolite transporter (DMT)-like permease